MESGKLSPQTNISDVKWKTHHCLFGFNVMGIWPPNSSGTDINAIDVSPDKGLVVTGDDFGLLKLMNYPCIVKNAPNQSYRGHSSHVMNVRFFNSGAGVASVGGNDSSVVVWNVEDASSTEDSSVTKFRPLGSSTVARSSSASRSGKRPTRDVYETSLT